MREAPSDSGTSVCAAPRPEAAVVDGGAPAERVIDTPLGPVRVRAGAAGVRGVLFDDRHARARRDGDFCGAEARPAPRAAGEISGAAREHAARCAAELLEYFAGLRREFTVPLDLRGTQFELAAWAELLRVPYGATRTYGRQAAAMGRARAVRAVGRANGRNPVAIIVPCHRVIGAGGALTGYGGGLERKRWLLAHEAGAGG